MISITELAKEKLRSFAEAEGLPTVVRLKVVGGGCGGMSQDMFFDDFIDEADEIIEQDGIKIIVDQVSIMYLENCEIDYVESQFQSGFKFNVEGAQSCGCGKSFSP